MSAAFMTGEEWDSYIGYKPNNTAEVAEFIKTDDRMTPVQLQVLSGWINADDQENIYRGEE